MASIFFSSFEIPGSTVNYFLSNNFMVAPREVQEVLLLSVLQG